MITINHNNKLISFIALGIFSIAILGTGYLYLQKYFFQSKSQSGTESTSEPELSPVETKADIIELEPRNDYEKGMLAAAKDFWSLNGGDSSARVILRDFGCHAGLEAVKEGETITKFEYDGKIITEIKL